MKSCFFDQRGSIITEYGILMVIVALSLIAVLGLFRNDLIAKFNEIRGEVTAIKVSK
jgi:Flp pilus assembly pilin Flp